MADGAVLKFPGGKDPKPGNPARVECPLPLAREGAPPPTPAIDSYDYDETLALYQIATGVKKKGEDLISFVDQNRITARQAGVEMIAVQITSILEGDKFQRVVDSLEDAVYRRIPISLTRDGADKVHRLERLIAEADGTIVHFMGGRRTEPAMGQSIPQYQIPYPVYPDRASSDVSTWIPVVIIGIAGIVGVIAIIALTRQPSVTPVVVSAKPSRKT